MKKALPAGAFFSLSKIRFAGFFKKSKPAVFTGENGRFSDFYVSYFMLSPMTRYAFFQQIFSISSGVKCFSRAAITRGMPA